MHVHMYTQKHKFYFKYLYFLIIKKKMRSVRQPLGQEIFAKIAFNHIRVYNYGRTVPMYLKYLLRSTDHD